MKKLLSNKKSLLRLGIICLALTIASVLLAAVYGRLAKTLQSQTAAERFRGKSEYAFAQASVFLPAGDGTDRQGIFEFQRKLDDKLMEASLEAPPKGRLYCDAFCAYGQVNVKAAKGSADIRCLGVGGDFFIFHPLRLRAGSYISGSDLLKDRVVIDEDLAWRLFGALDVVGMRLSIGERQFTVAGVIVREEDFASRRSYSDGAGMFLSFDALNEISETKISMYELCCAEPVTGFVEGAVREGFPAASVVKNTGRFGVPAIFGILRDFGSRSARTLAVAYPYWENAARMVEDVLCLVLCAIILTALFPVGVAAVFAAYFIREGWRRFKTLPPKLWEKFNDWLYERGQAKRVKKR